MIDSGNHESWEAKVDYRLDFHYERITALRRTDHDLYGKVGAGEGRAARLEARVDGLQRQIMRLRTAVYLLTSLLLAVAVLSVVAVIR